MNRSGVPKVQVTSIARAGMELAKEDDSSVTLTREDITRNLKFLPTPPKFWAGRKEPLSMDENKMRPRKLGDSC